MYYLLWYFFRSNQKDEYLLNLARDNTQLLINKIWELPFEKVDDVTVVKLPKQSYILPREKPLPKPRQLSKWEMFAKEKGLQKKKKAKVTWDDILKVINMFFKYFSNARNYVSLSL